MTAMRGRGQIMLFSHFSLFPVSIESFHSHISFITQLDNSRQALYVVCVLGVLLCDRAALLYLNRLCCTEIEDPFK